MFSIPVYGCSLKLKHRQNVVPGYVIGMQYSIYTMCLEHGMEVHCHPVAVVWSLITGLQSFGGMLQTPKGLGDRSISSCIQMILVELNMIFQY